MSAPRISANAESSGSRTRSGTGRRTSSPQGGRGAASDSNSLPGGRPAGMSKALAVDLRRRVVAAVAAGVSHREAAARFGVSAASSSWWRALERRQGDVRPGPLGGDRRSRRAEAQAPLILGPLEEMPDISRWRSCARRRVMHHCLAAMVLAIATTVAGTASGTEISARRSAHTHTISPIPPARPARRPASLRSRSMAPTPRQKTSKPSPGAHSRSSTANSTRTGWRSRSFQPQSSGRFLASASCRIRMSSSTAQRRHLQDDVQGSGGRPPRRLRLAASPSDRGRSVAPCRS